MDSISIAWWKRPNWAVTIDYGQKAAAAEILAATQVCKELNIKHEVLAVNCSQLGSGDLVQLDPDVHAATSDWWPYRNQLLITLACMRAISRDIQKLYIGTVKSDGDSHQDGTSGFLDRINDLTAYQEGGLHVEAPAIGYTTEELVRMATVPPSLLAWAHSCHKSNIACGGCRGCNKYLAVYSELGAEYSCFA